MLRSPLALLLLTLAGCNAAPQAPQVAIEPAAPTSSEDLVAVFTLESSDPDGDSITYSYAWYQKELLREDLTSDTVGADQTAKGEVWRVSVLASDGSLDSEEGGAVVTVGNSAPSVTVSILPENPEVEDDLEAVVVTSDPDEGDEVSVSYVWYRGEEGNTPTDERYYVVDSALTERGEIWRVEVTPNDGTDSGESVSAEVVVGNTAPEIVSITLDPDPATEESVITADVVATDIDEDEISFQYEWIVGGATVQEGETGSLDGSDFDKHDLVSVRITPNDGHIDGEPLLSGELSVSNSPPTTDSVELSPSEIYEADVVSCLPVGLVDVDDDEITTRVEWWLNGSAVSATETLDGDSFDKDDQVACMLYASDGEEENLGDKSDVVTVSNTAPVLASLSLDSTSPLATEGVTALLGGLADDDPADSDVTVKSEWFVNGLSTGVNEDGFDSLVFRDFQKGDSLYVVVTPFDSTDDGDPLSSETAVAINSVPQVTDLVFADEDLRTLDTAEVSFVVGDDDGDDITVETSWRVNGVTAGSSTEEISGDETLTSQLSGDGNFDKDDTVSFHVSVADEEGSGQDESVSLTVLNSPPEAPELSVSPEEPSAGTDDLICVIVESEDDDGDAVDYTFAWTVDGTPVSDGALETTSYFSDTVPVSLTSGGETWECQVTPNDGEEDGEPGAVSVEVLGTCNNEDTFDLYSYSAGGGAQRSFLADLDSDGALDILVANEDDGTISLFWGQGDGSFTVGSTLSTGDHEGYVSTGDMDSDGDIDILISRPGSNGFRLFEGNNGSFSSGSTITNSNLETGALELIDADQDGDLDVIFEMPDIGCMAFRPGNNSGGLGSSISCVISDEGWPRRIDVDGDGVDELALLHDDQVDLYAMVAGSGSATFLETLDTAYNPTIAAMDARDVDSDGDEDLVLFSEDSASGTWSEVVYFNDGDGVFTGCPGSDSLAEMGSAVGDLNGDGLPDYTAVVSDSTSSDLYIYVQY